MTVPLTVNVLTASTGIRGVCMLPSKFVAPCSWFSYESEVEAGGLHAPLEVRRALAVLEPSVAESVTNARLGVAA